MLVSLIDTDTQDQALQEILEEAQKPVYYHDDILGTFELVKGLDLFEKRSNGAMKSAFYFNLEEDEK